MLFTKYILLKEAALYGWYKKSCVIYFRYSLNSIQFLFKFIFITIKIYSNVKQIIYNKQIFVKRGCYLLTITYKKSCAVYLPELIHDEFSVCLFLFSLSTEDSLLSEDCMFRVMNAALEVEFILLSTHDLSLIALYCLYCYLPKMA